MKHITLSALLILVGTAFSAESQDSSLEQKTADVVCGAADNAKKLPAGVGKKIGEEADKAVEKHSDYKCENGNAVKKDE